MGPDVVHDAFDVEVDMGSWGGRRLVGAEIEGSEDSLDGGDMVFAEEIAMMGIR